MSATVTMDQLRDGAQHRGRHTPTPTGARPSSGPGGLCHVRAWGGGAKHSRGGASCPRGTSPTEMPGRKVARAGGGGGAG